jgi:hypothetical protein
MSHRFAAHSKPDIFGLAASITQLWPTPIRPKPGKRAILKSGTRFDFI